MSSADPNYQPPGGQGGGTSTEATQMLQTFWQRSLNEIRAMTPNDFKAQTLPLARIKKIMKLDEDVKMISAEAPVLFSKAAEIFISELSLRAWIHTEDSKRRTLQRNDIAMAITKFDQFDFLIDIVPRDELKPAKRPEENVQRTSMLPDQVQYYFQLAQQHQAALQQQQNTQTQAQPQQQQQQAVVTAASTPQPQQIQIQAGQVLQQLQLGQTTTQASAGDSAQVQPQVIQIQAAPQQQPQQAVQATPPPAQPTPQAQQQATTQVFQQVVTPSGEVQNIPLQLTQAQLQAIQMQMQGKQPGQPIIIQTATPIQMQQTEQQASAQPMFQIQQLPMSGGTQQVFIQQGEETGQEAGDAGAT